MKAGKFNVGVKEYDKPTPRIWRRLGDSLLIISTTITGTAVLGGNKVLALVAVGCGLIGKLLTNLFSE